MNLKFKKPLMLAEAQAKQSGFIAILEILIFVAVFYIATFVEVIPLSVFSVIVMFTSKEFMDAVRNGEDVTELSMELSYSEPMMIAQLFITIFMIIVVCLFCRLLQKRKMATLGFRKKNALKEYLIGLVVGAVVFSVIMGICVLTGAASLELRKVTGVMIGMLVVYFIGFMIQGMSEEVLCRGYFIISFARKNNKIWLGIIIGAVMFAALHLGNPGITLLSLVNLTLFGILAGIYFIKRGNIWGIAAYHSMWNFIQGNFYGIKVSGLTIDSSVFVANINENMSFINGGSFGIEGGILTTIVQLVVIIILIFTKQKECEEEQCIEKEA